MIKKFLPLIVSATFFMPAQSSAAPMTLSVHDADLRATIMLVAKTGGINVSIDDSVKGKISISLTNIEPLKILEIISRTKSLQLLHEGGVFIVTASSVEVMQSYVFPIKFGDAEILKEAVIMSLDPDTEKLPNQTTRIKNADGSYTYRYTYRDDDSSGNDYSDNIKRKDRVYINPEINALILFGTPAEYERVKKLLETLDVELKQVSVEAKVLAITKEEAKNLGVEWSWSSIDGTYSVQSGRTRSSESSDAKSSSFESSDSKSSSFESSIGYSGESSRNRLAKSERNRSTSEKNSTKNGYSNEEENTYKRVLTTNQSNDTNIFSGSTLAQLGRSGYGLIQFGRSLTSVTGLNWALSAQINALVTDGKAKILSRPNVTTIQGREAIINVGSSVPIPTESTTNSTVTTSFTYRDAGIILRYTPRINSDGTITAQIHTEVSTPQYVADMRAYRFNTRSADTTVTVRDGEPMVIGGLIGAEEAKSVSKIPFLGDLPILGALFRNHRKSKSESELVIFLTAHVVKDSGGGGKIMLYPINLEIAGRFCVVIGGGKVALRKIRGLLEADAKVKVISPEICAEIEELYRRGEISLVREKFSEEMIDDEIILIAATNDKEINLRAAEVARAKKILVNVVDESGGNFNVPSRIRRGDFLLTISTGANSPAFSKFVRQMLEAELDENFCAGLKIISEYRREVKRCLPNHEARKIFWQKVLTQRVWEMLKAGELGELEETMNHALKNFGFESHNGTD